MGTAEGLRHDDEALLYFFAADTRRNTSSGAFLLRAGPAGQLGRASLPSSSCLSLFAKTLL